MAARLPPAPSRGDLSVTALYTAQAWAWGQLPYAHLFASRDSRRVFAMTNAALAAARLVRRDLPSLPHSLVQRHLMIDHLLRTSGARAVIELAAGLSRRGAAFTRGDGLRYVEIDLPATIATKRALLGRSAEGRAVLATPGLSLVGADVETIELAPLAPAGEPVCVIAEGLVMYLSGPARRALFAKVARLPSARFVFDLVPRAELPPPGRVGRALEAAMKRFTGGRGFERDAHTRGDVLGELAAAGFTEARAIAPGEVASAWGLPHAGRPTQTLVFTCATPATPS